MQESFFDYMYKVWFLSSLSIFIFQSFLIKTCDLQKSFLVVVTWVFDCNEHGCKALLWGSFGWEIEVTFQTVSTYGQGNGLGPKGSYFCLHKTFVSLWPYSWSWVLETDSCPLRYGLETWNVHREATDVSLYTSFKWA
jgi:hypothetical protein